MRTRAALAARCAACVSVAASQAHVTKFGLSRDAGFFPLFQLEVTSMLSRTPRDELVYALCESTFRPDECALSKPFHVLRRAGALEALRQGLCVDVLW